MRTRARFFLPLLGLLCLFCASCSAAMVVNSEGDEPDADLSNVACATVNGDCTLRAALQQANKGTSGTIITFAGVTTITPQSPLPALTAGGIHIKGDGKVTLLGTGGTCADLSTGISIFNSNGNWIQGLTIRKFGVAIRIEGSAKDAKSNVIGAQLNSGGSPEVRNVIGSNCHGVYINGANASGNTVVGNYIGTDATGAAADPNASSGIVIINGAHDNLIGRTAALALPAVDSANEIAYWTLDEPGGNRADSVGSNLLAETSGTIDSVVGKVGNGADFEAADSEFFEVADNPDLSTGDIDFTLAGWVKLESEATYQELISKYDSAVLSEYSLYYSPAADRFILEIYNNAGVKVGSVNSGAAVSTGTWYFIAAWHDATANTVNIVVNNDPAQSSATTGAPSNTTANLRMGADSTAETTFLDGVMDEWGFWKRLLTPQEIAALYNGGNGVGVAEIGYETNVISANTGVGIYLQNADSNKITGNFIGVAFDGVTPLPNGSGISLSDGSDNNVIGFLPGDDGVGNVISGNNNAGISMQYSTGNLIMGNLIGTDFTGALPVGNGSDGVRLLSHVTATIIGTNGDGNSDDLERNVISGNGAAFLSSGVDIADVSTNNVVAGNYIGTDITGTVAIENNGAGISLLSGPNLVGTDGDNGSDALEANLISGNASNGVWIGSNQNRVAGNLIGTTADGMSALGNGAAGVHIAGGQNNIIGTNGDGVADAAERNVISANTTLITGFSGIEVQSDNNIIAGNYVGLNAAGTAALGNEQYGISLAGADGNLIGTDGDGVSDALERNVISGNAWYGVFLAQGSANNKVAGNYIGTDSTGSLAIPNMHAINSGSGAIQIDTGANNNTIGTDGNGVGDAAEGNVISGNERRGVQIRDAGSNNNKVAGNYIGVAANGTSPLGNGDIGVEIIDGPTGNVIGTNGNGVSDALEANVISSNGAFGVFIMAAPSNQVAGNFIGTDKTGTLELGNVIDGVHINASNLGNVNSNTVGGSLPKRNVIAFNGDEGVELDGFGIFPSSTVITYNSIYSNASLGIDLHPGDIPFFITPNDVGDGDTGANNLMNFPELDTAININNQINITGDIVDGLANTTFKVQFFYSPECDPNGYGEGKTYIGESNQMTNGSGDVSFLLNFNVDVPAGTYVTATATTGNNTSEFSACVLVAAGVNFQGGGNPPLMIIPLQNLNCRSYCTAQSDIRDTLLKGIQYTPIGWDPTAGYFAFLGPSFGERCYAPPVTGATQLMSLMVGGQEFSLASLTTDNIEFMACPAFSTPTPTLDPDEEGDNPTPVPACSDGIDNDGDGATDMRDAQCRNTSDNDEAVP